MKKSNSEKLAEHLLHVDEEIITNAYEIDDGEKLMQYIKTKNNRFKKPFYLTPVFRRVVAIVACFIFVIGVLFSVSKILYPNSGFVHNSDKPESSVLATPDKYGKDDPKKPLIISGDTPDVYYGGIENEQSLSRDEEYLSPALQEKMKTHGDTDVVYKVIVEILITMEDRNEFTITNDELLLLAEQRNAALDAYIEVRHSLAGVSDEEKRREIVEEIEEKREVVREIERKYTKLLRKYEDEYCLSIVNERLAFATDLSEIAPVSILDSPGHIAYVAYKDHAYFMELSYDDIVVLAEKGGYLFRLASAPTEVLPGLDQD